MVVTLAALAGLSFGSFANVVIHRLPRKESIVRPGSRCPACGNALRPAENIPVLSWLLLRGRCRRCSARISFRYPLVEALTAALFALAAARLPRTDLIAYLPLMWVLIVLAFIDLEHRLLPNRIVLPAIAGEIALLGTAAALGPGTGAWGRALAAGAASFLFFFALALIAPAGMGMGDVKLSALLGMALGYLDPGWSRVFAGFLLSFMIGAVGGIALIAARRGGMKTQVPFGPSLAAGTVIAVLWGDRIVKIWQNG